MIFVEENGEEPAGKTRTKRKGRNRMADYPWDVEAIIQATPQPNRKDLPNIPKTGTLACLIRVVNERVPEADRWMIKIEYGHGNPSLNADAIKAAYNSPTFPPKPPASSGQGVV